MVHTVVTAAARIPIIYCPILLLLVTMISTCMHAYSILSHRAHRQLLHRIPSRHSTFPIPPVAASTFIANSSPQVVTLYARTNASYACLPYI